jgi:uncharacterized protein YjbI with pentapeptide repeats
MPPGSTTPHEESDLQVSTVLELLAQDLLPILQISQALLTTLKFLERNLPADLQAILTVLGRRTRTFGNGESHQIDLHNTNLQSAKLQDAQLQGADLQGAQLQGAFLLNAQLQGAFLLNAQLQSAVLVKAQLQGAHLEDAQLQGAYLVSAQLQDAHLEGAQLQDAFLGGAQLQGAHLEDAQLQGAYLTGTKNLTQEQINTACVDEATALPEGLTKPAPCPTP